MKTASAILAILGLGLAGCAGSDETAASPVYESSRQVTSFATVEAVDHMQRRVTLRASGGELITCDVDESARNFHQVEVGDRVTVTYIQSAAVEIVKQPGEPEEETVVERAPAGQKPGGKMARERSVTAEVVGVDREKGTISLKDKAGDVTTVAVRKPERLNAVKVGDYLHITYAESVALKVDPAPAEVR